jgi:hypothetical protein
VLVDGRPAGTVTCGTPRPDVAHALGKPEGAGEAGFSVVFPKGTFSAQGRAVLTIEVTARDGEVTSFGRELWTMRVDNSASLPSSLPLAPIPADIMVALAQLKSSAYPLNAPWSRETVQAALSDIASIVQTDAIVKPVLKYAIFLRSMSAAFRFVHEHFDPINHLTDPSAKDYSARATSLEELLCISSHLYVLRSRGILDSVAEFGCFKGFSTCCLSQACAWLGVKLHVFDSFAGLPPSASGYYSEGDFRAPIDEVRDNVRTFGQLGAVEFHQGFFSETVSHFSTPVGCIWMDVDLESSARDVMALLRRIPAESCVFSHEMPSEAFAGDELVPSATEVLPPIVDAFLAAGRRPVGQHLAGLLGCIRSADEGVPALEFEQISTIVAAASVPRS